MPRSSHRSALLRRAFAAAALVSLGWGANAHAAMIAADGYHELATTCRDQAAEAVPQPASQPVYVTAQSSKSAAILGGQPSALEQIRIAQQAQDATPEIPAVGFAAAQPAPIHELAPAVGGARLAQTGCPMPSIRRDSTAGGNDFLASRRVTIGRTTFDHDWQRVSGDRISARRYRKLVGDTSGDGFAALRSVNSWVNREIAFAEDRDLFSRADFWAGAATTLKLRRGDCEDIALTKMQLLAAAGIPREDMVLTIARDLVRNADHAVLIVRYDGRYYMLDNASDEVFDAAASHDYRPILSFGSSQTWLHGY